jgi:hypothetical protein
MSLLSSNIFNSAIMVHSFLTTEICVQDNLKTFLLPLFFFQYLFFKSKSDESRRNTSFQRELHELTVEKEMVC